MAGQGNPVRANGGQYEGREHLLQCSIDSLERYIDRNFINPSGTSPQEITLPAATNTMLQIE